MTASEASTAAADALVIVSPENLMLWTLSSLVDFSYISKRLSGGAQISEPSHESLMWGTLVLV